MWLGLLGTVLLFFLIIRCDDLTWSEDSILGRFPDTELDAEIFEMDVFLSDLGRFLNFEMDAEFPTFVL